HVLAGGDGALQELRPQPRGSSVEEHLVVLAAQRGVEIGRPALHAVLPRQLLHLRWIAADEQRVGHQAGAVLQRHAALLADLEDRADEVLVHPHPSGDAVHDDADALLAHLLVISFIAFQSGIALLAKPGQSRLPIASLPLLMRTRTAPWLRS